MYLYQEECIYFVTYMIHLSVIINISYKLWPNSTNNSQTQNLMSAKKLHKKTNKFLENDVSLATLEIQ